MKGPYDITWAQAGWLAGASFAVVGLVLLGMWWREKRGACWLRSHDWQEIRVIQKARLLSEAAHVVEQAEWRVQCSRCGRDKDRNAWMRKYAGWDESWRS